MVSCPHFRELKHLRRVFAPIIAVPPPALFGFDLKYQSHLDRHNPYVIDGRDLCESYDGAFNALFICLHYAYSAPTPGARHRAYMTTCTHGSDRANPSHDCYIFIFDTRVRRVIRPTSLTTSQDVLRDLEHESGGKSPLP